MGNGKCQQTPTGRGRRTWLRAFSRGNKYGASVTTEFQVHKDRKRGETGLHSPKIDREGIKRGVHIGSATLRTLSFCFFAGVVADAEFRQ